MQKRILLTLNSYVTNDRHVPRFVLVKEGQTIREFRFLRGEIHIMHEYQMHCTLILIIQYHNNCNENHISFQHQIKNKIDFITDIITQFFSLYQSFDNFFLKYWSTKDFTSRVTLILVNNFVTKCLLSMALQHIFFTSLHIFNPHAILINAHAKEFRFVSREL